MDFYELLNMAEISDGNKYRDNMRKIDKLDNSQNCDIFAWSKKRGFF